MKVTAFTNNGGIRDHNEDAIVLSDRIIAKVSMSLPKEIEIGAEGRCFAVIDGMGGYKGGETAARLTALSFSKNASGWNITAQNAKNRLTRILKLAGQLIARAAQQNTDLASMGAAIAGIVLCSDAVLIFNCGDCRVYRRQGEYLEKLSHDHSLVQELYDRGELDEDGMRHHPQKNVITACVSSREEDTDIFFRTVPIKKVPQQFLICSDGVWEALSIDYIEKSTPSGVANSLLSLKEKCKDNVSYITIEL